MVPARLKLAACLLLAALSAIVQLTSAQYDASYFSPTPGGLQDVLDAAAEQAAAAEKRRVQEVTSEAAEAQSGGLISTEAFIANLTAASVRLAARQTSLMNCPSAAVCTFACMHN